MMASSPVQFTSAEVYLCERDYLMTFRLQPDRVLAEGVSGPVILAKQKDSTLRAVKMIPFRRGKKAAEREERFAQEVNILSGLDHPNLMGDVSAARCPRYFAINMPYFPNGTLSRCLDNEQPLSPPSLLNRNTVQLASAVRYLHNCLVFHGDIKLDNILVKSDGDLVLTDFGNSQILPSASQKLMRVGGTRPYIAPEVDNKTLVDPFKVDCFAVGVVVWCLVTGKKACDYEHEHFLPHLNESASVTSTYRTIVTSLLHIDPDTRWTADTFCQQLKDSEDVGEITETI